MKKEITDKDKVFELCNICDKLAMLGELVKLSAMYNPKSIEQIGWTTGTTIINYAETLMTEIDGIHSFFEEYYDREIQINAQWFAMRVCE